MKSKLIRNLSVNTLQLILNQLFGLIIFYLLSTGLDKKDFGALNLALAVLLAAFNILSLGIDQLMIKKIAAGAAVAPALSLYICHVLITGFSFYGLMILCRYFFPQTEVYNLILLAGIGKLMIFFSTPFKQVANGMERFNLLAYMSVASNLIRCISLLVFALLQGIGLKIIIIVFITGDLGELLVCIYLFSKRTKTRIAVKWNKLNYIKLLRESLPQSGVVVITSALARFDWIFIGFILSAVRLAEYSFAYRVFEIATFPMLAIAPLLLPLFTRLFQQQEINTENLKFLIRMELVVAALIILLLNICWSPVIDWVTAGKYGAVNIKTIFILSLCMPLLYMNNFLWTLNFAQGRFKMILTSFVITLLVNVAGDCIFIPLYQNEGAALAFFLSCLAQTIFYMKKNDIPALRTIWHSLIVCTSCAIVSGLIMRTIILNVEVALLFAVPFYVVLLIITRQLKRTDKIAFQQLFQH